MKLALLLFVCLLLTGATDAQSLSWLHGDWIGETYFPTGPVTRRIIVKFRVVKVTGSRFEALLDNLYPNDTTVRLERKITGYIINKQMKIESSQQVYIRDPRTQNFWRDCTGCEVQSDFSIDAAQVEIKLKTTNCSDECNGETVFSRDTSELNPAQQKDLARWFHIPLTQPAAKTNKSIADSIAITEIKGESKTDTSQNKEFTVIGKSGSMQKTIPANENVAGLSIPKTASDIKKKKSDSVISSTPVKPPPDIDLTTVSSILSSPAIQSKPVSNQPKKTIENVSLNASNRKVTPGKKDSLSKPDLLQKDTMPMALTTRTTNLVTTYKVTSPHIVIQLFDNAEIDGDVVTVYHNGHLIVNRQSLTHKAITLAIDATKAEAHHEFIMVADNLGLIPPNTALMRITAGEQKFELEVSSDFYNNAKIEVDYTGE